METCPGWGGMQRPAWGGHPGTHRLGWQLPDPAATAALPPQPCGDDTPLCSRPAWVAALGKSIAGRSPGLSLSPPTHCLFKRDLFSLSPNYQELRTSPCHLSAVTSPQRSSCRRRVPVLAVAHAPGIIMVLPYGPRSGRRLARRGTAGDLLHASHHAGPSPGHGDLPCSRACQQPSKPLGVPHVFGLTKGKEGIRG